MKKGGEDVTHSTVCVCVCVRRQRKGKPSSSGMGAQRRQSTTRRGCFLRSLALSLACACHGTRAGPIDDDRRPLVHGRAGMAPGQHDRCCRPAMQQHSSAPVVDEVSGSRLGLKAATTRHAMLHKRSHVSSPIPHEERRMQGRAECSLCLARSLARQGRGGKRSIHREGGRGKEKIAAAAARRGRPSGSIVARSVYILARLICLRLASRQETL